jgi:hypothetical protein
MRPGLLLLLIPLAGGSLLAETERSVPEALPVGETLIESVSVSGRCAEEYAQKPADYTGAIERVRRADGSEAIRGLVVASMTERHSLALFNREGAYRPPGSIRLAEPLWYEPDAKLTALIAHGTSLGDDEWPLGYSAVCWLSVTASETPADQPLL